MRSIVFIAALVTSLGCSSGSNDTSSPKSPGPVAAAGSGAMTAPVAMPQPPAAMNPQPAPEPTAKPETQPPPAAMNPERKPEAPPPAPVADWQPLVEGRWELPAGEEGYRCVRLTLTEDIYIKEFQPIAPLGTHHTLLSVNEKPVGADGVFPCSAAENGHVTLLGSGVGENYSAGPLPDGVAFKVPKGAQLNLNLHLFNVTDKPLTGLSGTKVRTTTADKVRDLAETILAGPISLSIPAGHSTSKGQCTIKSDTTVVAVAPHMHQLGVHLKAFVDKAAGDDVMLFDGPYDFEDQRQSAAPQLKLAAGDIVRVECTFENDTNRTVTFGESSLDEMCFIGLYRYPVAGEGLICLR